MTSSNTNNRNARARVRAATAERLAAERSRLEQNEKDLVEIATAQDALTRIDEAAAEKVRDIQRKAIDRKVKASGKQAAAVARLLARGERVESISDLSGLPIGRVRELAKQAKRGDADASVTADAGEAASAVPSAAPSADAGSGDESAAGAA